jgi:hypothetical protein
MKKLMIVLATLVAAATAHAAPLYSKIERMNFEKGSNLERLNIIGGQIVLDKKARQLDVFFYQDNTCPPGAMCTLHIMGPIQYSVKFKSVKKGACGETIYNGVEDKRRVDGIRQELTLNDNSTINYSKCRFVRAPDAVELYLDIEGVRPQIKNHHFVTGSALEKEILYHTSAQ